MYIFLAQPAWTEFTFPNFYFDSSSSRDLAFSNSDWRFAQRNGAQSTRSDNQLEEKVVDIESDRCQYYYKWNRGFSSSWEEKEKCYRSVINRKHCLKALRNRKKLKSIDKNATDILNANLFISENLTPASSKLAFNCRTLKRDDEIEKCYTINGIVHIVKKKKN